MMGFAPGVTITRSGVVLEPPGPGQPRGHGLADFGQPRCRNVMGEPGTEGLHGSFHDVGLGVEIRLPDLQMDDLAALRLQGPRSG